MMYPRSIVRLGLAVLLGWQSIAPFAHLSQHAREHKLCPVNCQESSDGAATVATLPAKHACTTCQWLTSNPGLSGSLPGATGTDHTLIPAPLDHNASPSYPAFDFNVAVARGPPAFSLAAI